MAPTSQTSALLAHYFDAKLRLGEWSGASQELLHVHAGLAIFVLSALLLRRKFRSPVPLALVVFFALLNEALDWFFNPATNPLEPFWDVLNTIVWPAILFLLARRWR